MNHRNNDGDGYYNNGGIEADPPPLPPTTSSCIASMGIALVLLWLMCFIFTHFTIAVYVFIFYLTVIYWFRGHDVEDFDPEDDEKAVKFLKAFLRAVKRTEERGRKEWKKVEGSIESFGSEEMVELGYRECSICMDQLEKGDKCLVFPGCGHVFHCKCIARWLRMKKLTCPVCRSSVDGSNANGTTVSELIALTSSMALIAAVKAAQPIYIFNSTDFVKSSWAEILTS